ncbi:DUF2147 domain-containing protein [Hymenobacter gummosus]|uniref:DUF2147 domain-containing protein n=1 Tax=Hymenobacter gummosus TaxID=1776032 RepID=A0A431TWQ0_9BACT|nr:DUF2147 domain-containing protein [Hymenobacter gummosus]RTQ46024.1 DUF2147 domain-containing protein [Hymenobacter gummosus]
MKRIGQFLLTALLLALATTLARANNPDAVLGVWKNGEGTGMVQIYKRGDKYFGRVVWLKVPNNPDGTPRTDVNNPEEKLRTRPLKGLENLRNFVYKGENVWEEGQVYDPKTGNDYSCEMKLVDANTLEVRGYIGVSLFGRTDVWKRQVKKS